MNRTPCEAPVVPPETRPTSGYDRLACVLPGTRVGAHKRNALVVLGYVVLSLIVVGALLRVL